jgi:ABC-type branched-subunit amino acid transport system ATPase component
VTGLDVFYGDFQALFGVSLSVAGGRATALVGANGAGKTTLLRTIAGEQQAVAIARALAAAPTLLLLDEISLGLAPRVVGELYQTLTALRAEGATLLIVEQDLRRAMAECDDLVCLLEGRVALAAPVPAVTREQVVAAYFGEGIRPVLAVHLLFLAVLAMRPNGLFASHQAAREAGALG